MEYSDFLATKTFAAEPSGFDPSDLPEQLFNWQRDIVRWAVRRGKAALFEDCGLGKTFQQVAWADQVVRHTGGDVLILAPLAVARQTVREAEKIGVTVTHCREQSDVMHGINITNYDILHKFDASSFAGVVLDESSILKSYNGATRTAIIESFRNTPYRLAATATPAPNDYMELGNHAEFLGVMTRTEMLAQFFTHDGGDTSVWRLKGHAEDEFWRWVCSWAVMLRKPSDLGYDDDGFALPPVEMHSHVVETDAVPDGYLFAVEALTLSDRRAARKASMGSRVQVAAELATSNNDSWLIWCDLNAEGDALEKLIPGSVQVAGSDSAEHKERAMIGFADGSIRVLITKPSIAGFGMNWQHCHNMAFVGLSDSYEQFYQAVRRCYRFGQRNHVDVHIITSDAEGAVVSNIKHKEMDAMRMAQEMVNHMSDLNTEAVHGLKRERNEYSTGVASGPSWTAHLGDCVEVVRGMEDNSIDYSVFSPPFASLYTYSNSDRDMGNARTHAEFYDHFMYLVRELYRVIKPGRLVSFHCMNLPTSKERDGYIGISDFRGDLIRMFIEAGFIFHSEVCIWKDPVTAMQRTKALGLLYKQLKKDSAMSRQGIPDYLVTMRKPGANPSPVTKNPDDFSVELWQRYASPVWMDINPSNTLQKESAREEKDERHICPLQLEVIERAIRLWTNPNDLVLSPFMGIGSEGYEAIRLGRRFVGAELKPSYHKQAVANLKNAELTKNQSTLFDLIDE